MVILGFNEALRLRLTEDAEDLAAFEERAFEPELPFEDVVRQLRRSGAIQGDPTDSRS